MQQYTGSYQEFLRVNEIKYHQSFYKSLGKYGCYFLCINHIAEMFTGKIIDPVDTAKFAINLGYIDFNFSNYDDSNNFFVERPDMILGLLTGKKWEVVKESAGYTAKEGEYVVECWQYNGNGHFAMVRDGYNSLQFSNCVENGKITSVRVFRRK